MPAPTAIDDEMTSAEIVCAAPALIVSAPLVVVIAARRTYACTAEVGTIAPSPLKPTKLCAIATPIDAPTPVVPPTPTAAEAATIVAAIADVPVAVSDTAPALEILASST